MKAFANALLRNNFVRKTNLKQKTQRAYPWLVLLLCSSFLFYKYVLQVSPSVMTQQLMHNFHVDGAGLGNLSACFFYSYLVMGKDL